MIRYIGFSTAEKENLLLAQMYVETTYADRFSSTAAGNWLLST
jgi:hypothetical protein